MTQSKEIRWIPLADITQRLRQRCGNVDAVVSGIDINKSFIGTRANLSDTDISQYYLVPPQYFACNLMHIGRDEKIPIAFNDNNRHKVVTSAYYVFTIQPEKRLSFLSEYINIFFHLGEFDRHAWFFTDSSVRGNLKENRFLDIKIPIPYKNGEPDIERQQEIVDIWQGLRRLKEENEAIAQPLLDICQAKMDELKHSAPMVALGEYIEQTNILNSNIGLGTDSVMGMTITKEVIPTKARISDTDISKFKVVYPGQFIYNPRTHGAKIGLGLNQNSAPFLISWNNISFKIIGNNSFNPTFLYLWFCRSEWDREACFRSWGSSTEVFAWKEFITMKIPKPSIEVQRAIVDIYHCARRAKKIAEEATQQLKAICPALMQYIIHS